MKGTRIYPNEEGSLIFAHPGEYGCNQDGIWYARVPIAGVSVGNLKAHTVVEHEDGTITVSPSILVEGPGGQWHGYLERGVWREV